MRGIPSKPANSFWERVATDLEIDVVSPFAIELPDGTRLSFVALVKDFGRQRGMLIAENYGAIKRYAQAIIDSGYGYATRVGASSEEYDRATMVAVLNDWGWTGPERKKPHWLL